MKIKTYLIGIGFYTMVTDAYAQFTYGNTGLMHLPTAEMQRDKTFMAGWSWLNDAALPQAHGYGWDRDPSMNYYLNITFFPWMEVSYTCTMIRGKYLAESRGLDPMYLKKWANQDRHFDFRFRVWKEGWWKSWTPQIVIGLNDALHTFEQNGTGGNIGTSDSGNGYWGRQYIVATKHFGINGVGTAGAHVAYLHNNRKDFRFEGVGAGTNLQLDKVDTGNDVVNRLIGGLNFMAEYDTRTLNAGAQWCVGLGHAKKTGESLFDLFTVCEMNDLKHFSGGAGFKVHLK